jgi:hypothetical protein
MHYKDIKATVKADTNWFDHQERVRWLADNIGLVNFFTSLDVPTPLDAIRTVRYYFYDDKDAIMFGLKFGSDKCTWVN